MRRMLTVSLWMMGISLLHRAAFGLLLEHANSLSLNYWMTPALSVFLPGLLAGILGAMLFLVVTAHAALTRRAIPWSRWHTTGAVAGAAMLGATVFWYPGFSAGMTNVVAPEMDFVESLIRPNDTMAQGMPQGMPRRYAQYIPEDPNAHLFTRLAFHAVYGASLGAGLGQILRGASRRWGNL